MKNPSCLPPAEGVDFYFMLDTLVRQYMYLYKSNRVFKEINAFAMHTLLVVLAAVYTSRERFVRHQYMFSWQNSVHFSIPAVQTSEKDHSSKSSK